MRNILVAGCLIALLASTASAGFPLQTRMKCAVGGQAFTHISTGSYSTWGSRPDGMPYGSWTFPLAIPECPDNRLVMFREFTMAEKKKLATLLGGPDYAAIRDEKSYFRAAWLAEALGDSDESAAWLMLRATWQAEPGTSDRNRYLRRFADQVQAIPNTPDRLDNAVLRLRAANALRELGEFDAATLLINATPIADNAAFTGDDPATAGKARENVRAMAEQFRRLIARRDASTEPLDAVPAREAAFRCIDADATLSAFDREFCQGALATEVAEVRKLRARQAD